jgi:hypothetical protein
MRQDRVLRFEIAAVGLQHADEILRQAIGRIAPHDAAGVEHAVGKRVQSRGGERAMHQGAIGPPDFQNAGDGHQRTPARVFQLAPERISAAQQRHIGGVLEIAEADDAGRAVRGAAVVARREAVDPDGADVAAGEVVKGGAARRAKPDHGDVEGHGGSRDAAAGRLCRRWMEPF